jgi:resuscitation-promoting factor RpfB
MLRPARWAYGRTALSEHRRQALARRRKRRKARTLLVATIACLLVIAAGVVFEKHWQASGVNPAAAALAGIPGSRTAAALEQQRMVYILEASESKSVTILGSPAVAQIQIPDPPSSSGNAPTLDLAAPDPGSAQAIAQGLMSQSPWDFSVSSQWGCLDSLWQVESGWNYLAENASGAYGIPQALPGSKMASAGADWATDPTTQIKWGLGYIQGTYGQPCTAWEHEEADGWY